MTTAESKWQTASSNASSAWTAAETAASAAWTASEFEARTDWKIASDAVVDAWNLDAKNAVEDYNADVKTADDVWKATNDNAYTIYSSAYDSALASWNSKEAAASAAFTSAINSANATAIGAEATAWNAYVNASNGQMLGARLAPMFCAAPMVPPTAPPPPPVPENKPVTPPVVTPKKEETDPHKKDLGYDPATKKYRENEAETALRVEKEQKVKLKRFTPTAEKKKGDWIDDKGLIYDGCSPAPKDHFDKQAEQWKKQLADHIVKVDRTVVDLTGLNLTPDQVKKVKDHIQSLPENDRKEVIVIEEK